MPGIRCARGTCVLVLSLGWLPVLAAQGGTEARAAAQREDLLAFGRDFLAVDRCETLARPSMSQKRLAANGRSPETHSTTVLASLPAASLNLRVEVAQVGVSMLG